MRSLKWLSVLALAACSAPIGPESAGSTDEAIVGGTAVANGVRSEVGMVFAPDGDCTGTLIAPDVVLTAAHCLTPEYTGTIPTPSNSFKAWDSTGQSHSYFANRIQAWGFGDDFTGSFTGVDDLALYHLGYTVPASVATPAVLAHAFPKVGDPAVVWGFGCADRSTGAGAGVKRYASFTFGDTTTRLCEGDSGGPVFGPVQGTNAIWGVNAEYRSSDAGDTGAPDAFSNVPYYKYQIELVMRQWRTDPQLETDVDRPGADYSVVSMTTAAPHDCFAACTRDASCRAFTYEPPAPGTTIAYCHLKSAVTDWVPRAGRVSGIPTSQRPATDRYGNDYREFDLPEDRRELCFAACAQDRTCASYAYASSIGVFKKHCWLKSAAGTETGNSLVSSGAKRPYEIGFDRAGAAAGDDYSVFSITDGGASQCAKACAVDDGCRAFSMSPPWSEAVAPQCHLKHYAFDPVPRASYVSGVKRGLEPNTHRAGTTYKTFTSSLSGPRPEVCQAACAVDTSCQSWSMIPQTSTTYAQCELKSTVGAATRISNYVSGIKGAEFFGADSPY